MKKGFTLIELLAVIVILAIIALIATPIILGIINDARKESQERSAELYLNGVELAIARRNLTEAFNPSECTITDGVVTCDGKELKVDVDGEVPESGTIILAENKITIGTVIVFNTFKVEINGAGEIEVGPKEETPNNGETPDSGSTQVTQPTRYYSWSYGNIGDEITSIDAKRTVAELNPSYPFYLGLDVEDGKISAAYLCFKREGNDTEYCLKGEQQEEKKAATYEANKTVLEEAFGASACSFVDGDSYCYVDGLDVYAYSNGSVNAAYDDAYCDVYVDGHFECAG